MKKFEGLSVEKIKAELKKLEGRIKRLERGDNFIEVKYEALLSERVFLNSKLEQTDEIIKSAVRRQKHPAREEYKLEGNVKVILEYKDMFLAESDTMVSAIHVKKGFDSSERTATLEFVNRVKSNELIKFKDHNPKTAGSFVVLDHPKLSARMSHHILYYRDGAGELGLDVLDLDILEKGIQNVLDDVNEKYLKSISFFPLGFDYILQFPVKEEKECLSKKDKEERARQLRIRGDAATMLADRMAEIIVQYFVKNPKTSIKTIYFGFVSYKTMRTLDKAFNKWGAKSKQELFIQNELSRTQKNLIKENHTTDKNFQETLKDISYSLTDDSTIVLLGETGVGKSYIAKVIRENSSRRFKPFKSINCANLRRELAESALFGHVKGSFTGALKDVKGPFELADGGILFLDEVGALDFDVQKMLLTYLDSGYFYRMGDYENMVNSNIKLIFGTNSNLEELVNNKEFAHDLYERIHQRVFTIPPLRERKGDIKNLLNLFLEKMIQNNKYPMEIKSDAVELLSSYNWYGNIRQLKFHIEKIYNNCKHKNINKITEKIVKNNPPRNSPLLGGNYKKFEKLLESFIDNWNIKDGPFLKEIVEPIVANIYIDKKLPVSNSSKFIGLTGSKGKGSPLHTQYLKYNEAIKKLKNL